MPGGILVQRSGCHGQAFLNMATYELDYQVLVCNYIVSVPTCFPTSIYISQLLSFVHCYRAYSIMDSSRISTFLISILLIVYGSFRSLNMEQEAREREKEKERSNLLTGITSKGSTGNSDTLNEARVQTLDTIHALCLPLGASLSLLIMFFFFDSMQMLLAICTASKSNESNLLK